MKKKELMERLTIAEAAGAALRIELDDTKEALRRSRLHSEMLKATLNSNRIVPLDEAWMRLFKKSKWLEYFSWLQFTCEEQKEFWISEFISLIS